MDRTKKRITRAAVELHGSVGPGATTMSAVAERAGVTRATLYRHFPTEDALFAACSRDWLAEHPRPDVDGWKKIDDPQERVGLALQEMYAYYRSSGQMLANLLRDVAALPDPIARNLASYPATMLTVLTVGWPVDGVDRVRRAVILHALEFETWRSLTDAGLADEEAATLMARFVGDCGSPWPGIGADGRAKRPVRRL